MLIISSTLQYNLYKATTRQLRCTMIEEHMIRPHCIEKSEIRTLVVSHILRDIFFALRGSFVP